LVFIDGVSECVPKLVVAERDRAMPVGRVAQDGRLALSEDSGSWRMPRNGAASIATVAAESPRPAMICASRPPNEWPMTAGLRLRRPMTAA